MRKTPLRWWGVCFLLLMQQGVGSSASPSRFIDRQDVRNFIKQISQRYRLSSDYLRQALATVAVRPRVASSVAASRTINWPRYQQLFLTPRRIRQGVAFWRANKAALAIAEKKYGIPREIIVAILGVETDYGEKQGNFRVIDSLATLGFGYHNRRSSFFKEELAHFLVLCHEQAWQPSQIYGSYAGAIGQPQFMPSNYRRYAVDFSGDGKRDLRSDTLDAIGSVANFLKTHGWQTHQGIIEPAAYQGKGYSKVMHRSNKAAFPLSTVHKYGVKTQHPAGATHANLLHYDGHRQQEYWLAYPNFFVITRYNVSRHYALAVYLLAQSVKNELNTAALSSNKPA